MALLTPAQLAYLKDHQKLFDDAYALPGESRDIEEYFDDYEDKDGPGSVYVYVCSDMGISPDDADLYKSMDDEPQVTWRMSLSEARDLHRFVRYNRSGGHQASHDALLEAINDANERKPDPTVMGMGSFIAGLRALLADETSCEVGRLKIEDMLAELRDSGISFPFPNNGLVIKDQDGSPSSIVRLSTLTALKIGMYAIIEHLEKESEE